MEFNRNHYFIAGILLLLAGIQFRYVASFELNEKVTKLLEKQLGSSQPAPSRSFFSFTTASIAPPRRVVRPPNWLGFSLMSIGGVLFAFSLTMPRPS